MTNFYLGKKFSSFDELQAVVKQYKEEDNVEFVIRHCISLNKEGIARRASGANQALLYFTVMLCCARGGRNFYSRGKGHRRRISCKIGCKAQVILHLSHCGQYLEVRTLNLDHNHALELRPPPRIEKRAEKRRLRLVKEMKVSYEEAVILERLKVKAKNRLVGPVEDDSNFDDESSESFDHFKVEAANVTSSSDKKHTLSLARKNIGEKSSNLVQKEDDNSRLSMGNSLNDSCEENYSTPLKQMMSKAKQTSNRENFAGTFEKKLEEKQFSDEEDYRRPLIIPTKKKKTDHSYDVPVLGQSQFMDREEENDNSAMEHDIPNDDKDLHIVTSLKKNIFTRSGDDGMSSTFSGLRLYKDDILFEALGTIEELSSSIGHAKEFLPKNCEDISGQLFQIQCVLQDMVIHVGTPQSSCSDFQKVHSQFPENLVVGLENFIQVHEGRLPKVNPIILPSGGPGSTGLHLARAVCRRAERKVVRLVREGDVDRSVSIYLNRLGDYLFVAARIVGFFSVQKECYYSKPKNYIIKPDLPITILKPTIPTITFNADKDQKGYAVIFPPQSNPLCSQHENPINPLSIS